MTEYRPWGLFRILSNDLTEQCCYQVKTIVVHSGQKLSLQYHNHRSEHWVIVKGIVICQVGEDFHTLTRNQSIYIPKGVKHRIINESNEVAELIEIQIGDSINENDIVRLEDDYGRTLI
jgi:mannose-1-phosphate guanylyltransferase/mannose-6-phosphate isomerase